MNSDMLSTFTEEVARLSAFSDELTKVAVGWKPLVGVGAAGGALALAGGQRASGDYRRGRRQRISAARQRKMMMMQQKMQRMQGGGY